MTRKSGSKRHRDKFRAANPRLESLVFANPTPTRRDYNAEICKIFQNFNKEDFKKWWESNQIERLNRVIPHPDGTATIIQFSPGIIIPDQLSTDHQKSEFDH